MKNWLLVALVLTSAACEQKKEDAPPAKGTTSATPTAAASSDTKSATTSEPEAPKALTVEQYTADIPVAACKSLTTCKNEEVAVSIGAMMMLMAGFAGMENPELGKELKAIGETMKKDKRSTMNGDECTKVMAGLTKALGFTPDKIKASVDAKKVEFNGENAAACSTALAQQPNFCKEEKKLEGEPNLGALDKMMKTYEKDIEAYLKPCEDTLVGKVAAGEACEYDFECAGDKVQCKQKKCVAKKD